MGKKIWSYVSPQILYFIIIVVALSHIFFLRIPYDHALLMLVDFILALGISALLFSWEIKKVDKIIGEEDALIASKNSSTISILSTLGVLFIIIGLVFSLVLYMMSPSGPEGAHQLFSGHFKHTEYSKLAVAQFYTVGALLIFSRGSEKNLIEKLELLYARKIIEEKEKAGKPN